MDQNVILSRLLDKYENSRHLSQPGVSTRRVMLRIEKKEFPEYRYEDASVRDACNRLAIELEQKGLVTLEWVKNRPVISVIALRLDHVMECYQQTGRTHPQVLAGMVSKQISGSLAEVSTPWIAAWRDSVCKEAADLMKVPSYCKNGSTTLQDLLVAFGEYDRLNGSSITMRAFSNRCYHHTKYFEQEVRDTFLNIAKKYDLNLAAACEQSEMGIRDQLAFLGIYARPELYELSGNFIIQTKAGSLDFSAAAPFGMALPSTLVDSIIAIDITNIHKVIFIENKTNYDEYLISQWRPEEMVIYHGGFLSPQKRKLFAAISAWIPNDAERFFWADIDLGGFQMFTQLQHLIPRLSPLRMSGDQVEQYRQSGLVRNSSYLFRLEEALKKQEYPLFSDAIERILEYGVTIEQEVFLR